MLRVLFTIFCCTVLAFCASHSVFCQHLWANGAIFHEGMKGNFALEVTQGILLHFILIPLIAGAIYFGYFKEAFKLSKFSRFFAPLPGLVAWPVFLGTTVAVEAILKGESDWNREIGSGFTIGCQTIAEAAVGIQQEGPETVLIVAAVLFILSGFAYVSEFFGEFIYRSLSKRTSAVRLLLPGVFYFIASSMIEFAATIDGVPYVIASSLLLAGTVMFGVYKCRFTSYSSALVAALFTSLPLLTFHALSLLSAVEIGFQIALLCAGSVALHNLLMTILGACAGVKANRRRERRELLAHPV